MSILIMAMEVIAAFALPATLAWILGAVGIAISGRGTRPRYVASTIERLARWPMIAARCLGVALYLHLGMWGHLCFTVLGLSLAVWFITVFAGNDEDFWTGRGRRLKVWLVRALVPRRTAAAAA